MATTTHSQRQWPSCTEADIPHEVDGVTGCWLTSLTAVGTNGLRWRSFPHRADLRLVLEELPRPPPGRVGGVAPDGCQPGQHPPVCHLLSGE